MAKRDLMSRLNNGDRILVGEGYVMELERRGYLVAGTWIPECTLSHPEVVKALHEEYAHAGSDIVVACTYYGNREKLRAVQQEHLLEDLNRKALRIARQVADETGTLMAGDIGTTSAYVENDPESIDACIGIFAEQTKWAVEEGADLIVAETFNHFGEAKLAVETIKAHSDGLPLVVTVAVSKDADKLIDDVTVDDACQMLELAGADVVGLNCFVGPKTMLPLLERVRAKCKGPIAALPCMFRTDEEHPTMIQLRSSATGEGAYPIDIDEWLCSRTEIRDFTVKALELGINYLGLCCGSMSHSLRVMADEMAKTSGSSKFRPNIELNHLVGSTAKKSLKNHFRLQKQSQEVANEETKAADGE